MTASGDNRTTVTHDDLKKWRSLADAATLDPWRYDGIDIVQLTDAGKGYPLDYYPDSKDVVIGKCSTCGNTDVGIQRRDDAVFIATARGAVPALIEFLEAAEIATSAEIAQLREALREVIDLFDATWCPEYGHAPRPEQLTRIAELRKLVPL